MEKFTKSKKKTTKKTCYQHDRTVGFDLAFPLLLHLICASLSLVGKRRHVFTDALNWKLTGSITLSRQPLTGSEIHAHAWLQGKRQNSCRSFTPGLPRQVRSVSRWRGATVHILQFRIITKTKTKKEKTQCLLVQRYFTAPRSSKEAAHHVEDEHFQPSQLTWQITAKLCAKSDDPRWLVQRGIVYFTVNYKIRWESHRFPRLEKCATTTNYLVDHGKRLGKIMRWKQPGWYEVMRMAHTLAHTHTVQQVLTSGSVLKLRRPN